MRRHHNDVIHSKLNRLNDVRQIGLTIANELRSLIAYLASPAQTPFLATADSAANLFNRRDLGGWQGDPDL